MADIPILDETCCTGCGDCVHACPVDCLDMAGPVPWLPRPLECIACQLCAWICPVTALAFPDGERGKK